jgi:putative phage-type endonuclease
MDLVQRSADWFAARRGKLTASNLGAALGQVSYTSRAAALQRALGTDKFVGNCATQHGQRNEMNGITDYQILSGNIVEATGVWVHPDYDWFCGSPDGLVGEEGMIEVKCPFYKRPNGQRLHTSVPVHYWMQVNALLEITGRKWCDYICWGPEGFVVHRVSPDPITFEYLLNFYSQFYSAIAARAEKPPPMSRETRERIHTVVSAAIQRTVDVHFWRCNYDLRGLTAPPAASSDEEEEEYAPRRKRQRLSPGTPDAKHTSLDCGSPEEGEITSNPAL